VRVILSDTIQNNVNLSCLFSSFGTYFGELCSAWRYRQTDTHTDRETDIKRDRQTNNKCAEENNNKIFIISKYMTTLLA